MIITRTILSIYVAPHIWLSSFVGLLFPGYRFLFPLPAQVPIIMKHTALLPSRGWKLFKYTINRCPASTLSLLRQESAHRWSACPNDTAPHRGGRDPYQGPLDPNLWAGVSAPRRPVYIQSGRFRYNTGTLKMVAAGRGRLVLSGSFTSQSKSVKRNRHFHCHNAWCRRPNGPCDMYADLVMLFYVLYICLSSHQLICASCFMTIGFG